MHLQRILRTRGLLALSLFSVGAAARADIVCTWTGGASGVWSNSTAWTPGAVPNNGGGFLYSAVVDGGIASPSIVTVNISPTVQTLSITAGDSVAIAEGRVLTLAGGFLTNGGTLSIESTGSPTDLRLAVDTVFDGGGVVVGANLPSNRLYGANNAVLLTNKLGHAIRGTMQLGLNNLVLSNAGVIQADAPGGILLDLTDAPTHLNIGSIRAANGATMSVSSGTFQNTDGVTQGVFEADAGSVLAFGGGVTIQGGILRDADGDGAGAVRNFGTLTLSGVTIDGPIDLTGNTTTNMQGSMALNGRIDLRSSGGTTDLVLRSTPFQFAGSVSTLSATNTTANRLYGSNNMVRLVVPANGYIHGGLQLGINNLLLDNAGLIEADSSAGIVLDLTDSATTQFNSGTIRARNGATLSVQPAIFDNTGGLIEAAAGSLVAFNGVTVSGGTIRDADGPGPGLVRNVSATTLKDLVIDGPFNADGGTVTRLSGAIAFNGPVNLNSTGGTTDVVLMSSPFTWSGTSATLNASNFQANRIYGDNNLVRLVVPAGATLHGGLQVGINNMLLTNHGLIEADSSAGIVLDLTDSGTTQFNDGTIRASNGAAMTVSPAHFDNMGGLFECAAGSTMTFSGCTVANGIIRDADGDGAGTIRFPGTNTLDGVTIQGTAVVPGGSTMNLKGAMDIQGKLSVESTGGTTDLVLSAAPFTLSGQGQTVCSNFDVNRVYALSGSTPLTIAAGHTLHGGMQLGINLCGIVNAGALIADTSAGINIDPADAIGFRNDGLLEASGGNLIIQAGTFQNTGTVRVDAGRALSRAGAYLQTAGLTRIDGSLVASGVVTIQGGVLGGTGQLNAVVSNTAGTVAPGNSTGVLTLTQGYTQSSSGTLRVEIGGAAPGTGHDQLSVIGNIVLAGALEVVRTPGFVPSPGQQFTVLTHTGSRTGTFASVVGCDPVSVTYGAGFVAVQFVGTPGGIADLNSDGRVDGADLGVMLGSWGACISPCCVADLNGDGMIDGADLGVLLGNWG